MPLGMEVWERHQGRDEEEVCTTYPSKIQWRKVRETHHAQILNLAQPEVCLDPSPVSESSQSLSSPVDSGVGHWHVCFHAIRPNVRDGSIGGLEVRRYDI